VPAGRTALGNRASIAGGWAGWWNFLDLVPDPVPGVQPGTMWPSTWRCLFLALEFLGGPAPCWAFERDETRACTAAAPLSEALLDVFQPAPGAAAGSAFTGPLPHRPATASWRSASITRGCLAKRTRLLERSPGLADPCDSSTNGPLNWQGRPIRQLLLRDGDALRLAPPPSRACRSWFSKRPDQAAPAANVAASASLAAACPPPSPGRACWGSPCCGCRCAAKPGARAAPAGPLRPAEPPRSIYP